MGLPEHGTQSLESGTFGRTSAGVRKKTAFVFVALALADVNELCFVKFVKKKTK